MLRFAILLNRPGPLQLTFINKKTIHAISHKKKNLATSYLRFNNSISFQMFKILLCHAQPFAQTFYYFLLMIFGCYSTNILVKMAILLNLKVLYYHSIPYTHLKNHTPYAVYHVSNYADTIYVTISYNFVSNKTI